MVWFLQIAADTRKEVLNIEKQSWFRLGLKEMVPHHPSPCGQPRGKQNWESVGSFCLAVLSTLLFRRAVFPPWSPGEFLFILPMSPPFRGHNALENKNHFGEWHNCQGMGHSPFFCQFKYFWDTFFQSVAYRSSTSKSPE